jgi:pimeloyl-ACP methyl ester carboxylesterase
MERCEVVVHGHRIAYRTAGAGPVLVLVHGLARSSDTWDDVLPQLAERHCVIALDLPGHGHSAKPRGDYSLGAHASAVRDLLLALGHDRVAVVGHSFGGGVAMQFAYQFPEWCERLVLVASGGLGREVHPVLRVVAVPGMEFVLPLVAAASLRTTVDRCATALRRLGLRAGPDLEEIWAALGALGDAEGRRAFFHTIRAVIDAGGQRVSAANRLYLAAMMPTLIVWGGRDPIIPVEHAREAHGAIAGSRLEVFPDAGHFPHRDDPRRFAAVLREFMASPAPARLDLRQLLRAEPVPALAPLSATRDSGLGSEPDASVNG